MGFSILPHPRSLFILSATACLALPALAQESTPTPAEPAPTVASKPALVGPRRDQPAPHNPPPLLPLETETPAPPADHPPAPTPSSPATEQKPVVETVVFLRHGEKPENDSGQLTCQGLNRALALSDVLIQKFGRPTFLFAPLPSKKINKEGTFSYVRPLVTIEPTAIRVGLPVETRFAYQDIDGLQSELLDKSYQGGTIFVAWEHKQIVEVVRHLLAAFGGDEQAVPEWSGKDFDSLYVVRLETDERGKRTVTFAHDHEGLDGQSVECPGARAK